jgi:hypothetical protein
MVNFICSALIITAQLIGAITGCALTLLGLSFKDDKIPFPGIAILCPPGDQTRESF